MVYLCISKNVMMIPATALLLFSFLQTVVGEKHSLYYLYTIQSSNTDNNIYTCTAVTLLNDKQIDFYNSTDESRSPKQDWMKEISESDWKTHTEKLDNDRQWLNKLIVIVMNERKHNKSGGHVLQWRHGCEGERHPDGSVTLLNSTNEFAYDGEDLISFNCTSETWLTSENQKNRELEEKWNTDHRGIAVKKCEQCEEMLKIYLQYNTADLKPRQTPPAVHIFAKKSKKDLSKLNLTCLATGFYPKDMVMSVRKFGTSLPEHLLTSSGVRPNDDGTYQLRKSVDIQHDTTAYGCSVSHSSLSEAVIKKWDDRLNKNAFIIGGVVVAVVLCVPCALCVILWVLKKRAIISTPVTCPPGLMRAQRTPAPGAGSPSGLPLISNGVGSPSGPPPSINGAGSPSGLPLISNGNVHTGAGSTS